MLCCAIAIYLFGRIYMGLVSLTALVTGRPPEVRENAASAWTREAGQAQVSAPVPASGPSPRFRMGAALALVLLTAGLPVLIGKVAERAEATPKPLSVSALVIPAADATAFQAKER